MSAMTIFYQECPVCGRSLRIPAKYFGRLMSCTHCEGEFRAGTETVPAKKLSAETVPAETVPVCAPSADADLTASMSELCPTVLSQPQLGEV
jgi:hypothetical protein